jgi:hypothetical protein
MMEKMKPFNILLPGVVEASYRGSGTNLTCKMTTDSIRSVCGQVDSSITSRASFVLATCDFPVAENAAFERFDRGSELGIHRRDIGSTRQLNSVSLVAVTILLKF